MTYRRSPRYQQRVNARLHAMREGKARARMARDVAGVWEPPHLRIRLTAEQFDTGVPQVTVFERQTHADARAGKHLAAASEKSEPAQQPLETKLQNALAYIAQQLHIGSITAEQATEQRAAARAKHGVKHA